MLPPGFSTDGYMGKGRGRGEEEGEDEKEEEGGNSLKREGGY